MCLFSFGCLRYSPLLHFLMDAKCTFNDSCRNWTAKYGVLQNNVKQQNVKIALYRKYILCRMTNKQKLASQWYISKLFFQCCISVLQLSLHGGMSGLQLSFSLESPHVFLTAHLQQTLLATLSLPVLLKVSPSSLPSVLFPSPYPWGLSLKIPTTVTIPYFNCSQSIKDSWFVSIFTHVPTKKAKSLIPSFGGTVKYGQDRNRCSEIEYATIP